VLDPFGAHPVVMTGSHNLGLKASSKNDDNLMIVEGNGPLAAAYAAKIIAIYQTYRWNSYVEAHRQDPKVWHGLVDNDTWQNGYLDPSGNDWPELQFWMGMHRAASAATPSAPSAAQPRKNKRTAKHPPAKKAAARKKNTAKRSPGKKTTHRAASTRHSAKGRTANRKRSRARRAA
jgi:hypothetical protein